MHSDELKTLFDQQAAGYDQQWAKMAPMRDALHYLLESVLAEVPDEARILCVGVGTGAEMAHLAGKFPRWRFTAVEPSGAMLEVCRQRAVAEGFAARCDFHEGYLDSLPAGEPHDAATCFLVSQFILEPAARADFFRAIADRLKPGGILASSDLASDTGSAEYAALLRMWLHLMASGGVTPEGLERMREAYARDVAVLSPERVASIVRSGGFETPVRFFQAGLIHAWYSRRASRNAA
jgi:tRNA (cmo5U34)-methyltransferase